ncbi:sporulation histidine kinase inhibitor Sda [Oceanobacillus salinisoli]|nr:sporulation histidine kinase inhibitor Sda [Oceanobacillus salinisoli]
MEFLSDDTLIRAYKRAVELGLEEDFIELLANELRRRDLVIINGIQMKT